MTEPAAPVAPVRLCVLGPSGRMGRAVLDAAASATDIIVTAAVDRAGAPLMGEEVALAVIASDSLELGLAASDVYIDFSTPRATLAAARIAASLGKPAVIGTTGLDADGVDALNALAEVAPVVVSANFSLGVNVLLGLARRAARALGPEWDPEIMEIHHRGKRDAPSGTAIALGLAIADGLGSDYEAAHRYARAGDVGARADGEIGVMALRGGDVVGEHTAFFFGKHERIELSHRATSRSIFAFGALRAATWAVRQPPGRYDMQDVLGLT